jgi:hypothetical protein
LKLHQGKRQAMTVGSNHSQVIFLYQQQQAVQIVANVLLRHGVLHHGQDMFQFLLLYRYFSLGFGTFRKLREVLDGKRLQIEAAFSRFDVKPVLSHLQYYLGLVRKRAQYVLKFFCRYGNRVFFPDRMSIVSRGVDLNFQISCNERDFFLFPFNEHI